MLPEVIKTANPKLCKRPFVIAESKKPARVIISNLFGFWIIVTREVYSCLNYWSRELRTGGRFMLES